MSEIYMAPSSPMLHFLQYNSIKVCCQQCSNIPDITKRKFHIALQTNPTQHPRKPRNLAIVFCLNYFIQ